MHGSRAARLSSAWRGGAAELRGRGRRKGEKKREKGEDKKEKEKEMKKMRKRERKRRREGAVRASGDCGRGLPRVASPRECRPRGWARGQEGREEKGEREKKEGRDSRRSDATCRAGWEMDGT